MGTYRSVERHVARSLSWPRNRNLPPQPATSPMVFPLYDEQARKRVSQPYVTWGLVALNVAVFIAEVASPGVTQQKIVHAFGFTPAGLAGASRRRLAQAGPAAAVAHPAHRHVRPSRLGSSDRQHGVLGDLRRQCRGCARPPALSR